MCETQIVSPLGKELQCGMFITPLACKLLCTSEEWPPGSCYHSKCSFATLSIYGPEKPRSLRGCYYFQSGLEHIHASYPLCAWECFPMAEVRIEFLFQQTGNSWDEDWNQRDYGRKMICRFRFNGVLQKGTNNCIFEDTVVILAKGQHDRFLKVLVQIWWTE